MFTVSLCYGDVYLNGIIQIGCKAPCNSMHGHSFLEKKAQRTTHVNPVTNKSRQLMLRILENRKSTLQIYKEHTVYIITETCLKRKYHSCVTTNGDIQLSMVRNRSPYGYMQNSLQTHAVKHTLFRGQILKCRLRS